MKDSYKLPDQDPSKLLESSRTRDVRGCVRAAVAKRSLQREDNGWNVSEEGSWSRKGLGEQRSLVKQL